VGGTQRLKKLGESRGRLLARQGEETRGELERRSSRALGGKWPNTKNDGPDLDNTAGVLGGKENVGA